MALSGFLTLVGIKMTGEPGEREPDVGFGEGTSTSF
jgi:hypothetical protein